MKKFRDDRQLTAFSEFSNLAKWQKNIMKIPRSVADLPKFEKLPPFQRIEIENWISQLERVEPPIVNSLKRAAEVMGCPIQTATAKYYAWKKWGWRVLINYAKLPYHDKARYRFYAWWHKLCLKSKSVKEAHREFTRLFKAGETIPGLPELENRERLPSGFDYNSLIRHAPKKRTICRRALDGARLSCTEVDIKFEALASRRDVIKSGDSIADIKFNQKSISVKAALALLSKTQLTIVRKNYGQAAN